MGTFVASCASEPFDDADETGDCIAEYALERVADGTVVVVVVEVDREWPVGAEK